MRGNPCGLRCAQPRGAAHPLRRLLLARPLRIERLEDRRLLTAVTSTINVTDSLHAANTNLLGVNLAWWDVQQMMSTTQQMTQAAGLDFFRFPGGGTADDAHFNVANGITLPQFSEFIASVGGTGVATVDYGSGSPQEAAAELAYLEGSPTDTTQIGTGLEWSDSAGAWQTVNWGTVGQWASLRGASPLAVNDGLNFLRVDHPAAFTDVPDWEIGNEEYGSWEIDHHGTAGPGGVSTGAAHDPATYAAFSATFATLAAEITKTAGLPNISIGVDSDDPTGKSDKNWTVTVLSDEKADGLVPGFISDHAYAQIYGQENDSTLLNDTVTDAGSVFDWSTRYNDYEADITKALGSAGASVQVIATEYNSVNTNPGKQTVSLVNGLYTAESIGSLLDSGYAGADIWDWNNNPQTGFNDSSSLYGWREFGDYGLVGNAYTINPPATGTYIPFPSYFGIQLGSKLDVAGGTVVSATSTSSNLNVYAVEQAGGQLNILVVNTSSTSSISDTFTTTGFTPGGSATVWQYGETQDTAQENSTAGASALANSTVALSPSGSTFSYSFPAYSMTVLQIAPAATGASSSQVNYTAGAAAVALGAGFALGSGSSLSAATVTIGSGYTPGDKLNFTAQSGISIVSDLAGVLTLTGSATLAGYQAALQSVTFSSTSTSTAARTISIVAIDNGLSLSTATVSVNVTAPVSVTGAYVSGSAWTTSSSSVSSEQFDNYLVNHNLGDSTVPAVGYALKTGANQTTDIPWTNINTISVSFSGPVRDIGLGSLELLGGTGTGSVAAPGVIGFTSDGNNTYSWTLASSLGNNKYVLAIATTGSSFGTTGSTQVVDANGAGISGMFTTGSSSFPSGNGLAGSTFSFAFDVLPGDGEQQGLVNSIDAAAATARNNDHETSTGYSPYFDYLGAGLINPVDTAIAAENASKRQSAITAPTAPAAQQAGITGSVTLEAGLTTLALAVQENVSVASAAQSNVAAATTSTASVAASVSPTPAVSPTGTIEAGGTTPTSAQRGPNRHAHFRTAAVDEALSAWDLTDLTAD